MSKRRPRLGRRGVSEPISTLKAALLVLENLGTVRALSIAILVQASFGSSREVRNSCLREALGLKFDPLGYDLMIHGSGCFKKLAERVSLDYLASRFLSKIDWDLGVDRQDEALKRFMNAEEACGITNQRFSHSGLVASSKDPTSARFVEICFRAKSKIAKIVGKLNLDKVVDLAGYGPGVTLEARNRPTLPAKISTTVVFSPSSWRLLSHVIGGNPLMFEATTGVKPDGPCCTYGNQVHADDSLAFVPKTWKTDRTICIGSTSAIYIQKGIGKLLRHKLKRAGVDLDDQSRNQALAEEASLEGSLATIDLESASDSISRGLVQFLMPEDWFTILESVRSKWTVLPSGERLFLNKFSAMGNGYTFELESLIFYALTEAFYESIDQEYATISVYGDDIVCPSRGSDQLIEFFSFCGFRINKEKTFVSGYFRESCGKDFIHGFDVRPFFIKKDIDYLEDYFKFANQIRAWGIRGDNYRSSNPLRRVSGCIYHCVDPRFRYRVPSSFPGDAGFHSSDPPRAAKPSENGYSGTYFRYWGVVSERRVEDSVSALAAKLMAFKPTEWWQVSEPDTGNEFAHRARSHARRASRMGYTFDWI